MADLGSSFSAPGVEDFGLWLTLDVVHCPYVEDFGLWLNLEVVPCPFVEAFITLDWSCSWSITKSKVKNFT